MPSRKELAAAIRVLSMDAVEQAKSGHPGAPMGMADMAEALWNSHLKHNPGNPNWPDRDRFVLSNGHASMLLYSLLHLSGYALSMDDIRHFRQWGSLTPGHPEHGCTPGVEVTTGPLGQGLGMACGLAIAERCLAATFNRPDFPIVDHYTYAFAGDGCMMEGVSHEVCSLAGTLGLGKLIVLYDANNISIDGCVSPWFGEDVGLRFEAYGWQVLRHVDGQDGDAVSAAIAEAKADKERPTLIICATRIGCGAPNKAGSAETHGAPLGAEEIAATRAALNWSEPPFSVPPALAEAWDARAKGAKAEEAWNKLFKAYSAQYPEEAVEFKRRMAGELPPALKQFGDETLAQVQKAAKTIATRVASRDILAVTTPHLPELFGGSADLGESTGARHAKAKPISRDNWDGNYLPYGVREFGMGTIMNGLALHKGFIPCGSTFLTFSDYARNAIRLAGLMETRLVWILTHDSIALGEDGPTHQPIEHLSALRMIPNVDVWRPCDSMETAVAWKAALEREGGPTCLALSRQNLPFIERTSVQVSDIARGGYIVHDSVGQPQVLLIATGSEVALAIAAADQLAAANIQARVISMPCCDVFDRQPPAWRERVLPRKLRRRVAIEAGSSDFWWKYVGLDGVVIGMDQFGASAPGKILLEQFGFTAANIATAVERLL